MGKSIQIQSVMTLCPHSIGLDQDVQLARKMMRDYGFRHLPVQVGGKLVGIVSDRDIKFATAYARHTEGELGIEDVYIPEPYIVAPTTELREVLKRLADDKLGCALVVANEKLVGIFTTVDACRVLAEQLE